MTPAPFVSEPMPLEAREDGRPFRRADLEFYGIDHSGSSFEARVFLNNPAADEETPRDEASGYAGSFWIFGHGGCFGDTGHCHVPVSPRDPFDRRGPHQLTPHDRGVIVTEALRKILDRRGETGETELTATVVPVASRSPVNAEEGLFSFERLALVKYD